MLFRSGDAVPVGLPLPPTGVWASSENIDTFASLGYVPAFATMAATESPDYPGGTPNQEPYDAIGWLGWVPACMTLNATDRKDTANLQGWVIGDPADPYIGSVVGQLAVTESADRVAGSNYSSVTGTWHSNEDKDRPGIAGFEIPKAAPTPLRKRRVLLVN